MNNDYLLNWSNAAKQPILVPELEHVTNQCSLDLIGKNVIPYGQVLQENILRLMENFCSDSPPLYPTDGQMWYDSANNELNIFVENQWTIISKSDSAAFAGTPTAPTAAPGTNTTQIATTEFVETAIQTVVSTGNVNSASKLAVARSISATGDASWSVNFDGSQDVMANLTLSDTGVVSGTFGTATSIVPFTVDSKGRITAAGAPITITPNFSSITNTPSTLSGYGIVDAVNVSQLGVANGVATLNSSGLVNSSQLPSYVDDVVEYATLSNFPGTGETGKIYVDVSTIKIYRWSGSVYIEISPTAGNSDTATKISTARNISMSGDGTWTVSFDGSSDVSSFMDLSLTGVAAGNYTKVTVDTKGRVTSGSTPTTLAGYNISDAQPLIVAGTVAQYYRGDKTWATLDKSAIGLSNVENTALSTWAGSTNLTTAGTLTATTVNVSGILTIGDGSGNGATFQKNYFEKVVAVPWSSTPSIPVASGSVFYATATSNATLSFSLPTVPAGSYAASFSFELTNGGNFVISWPSSVKWPGGSAPTLTNNSVDVLTFYTRDGGTTWRGALTMKDSR